MYADDTALMPMGKHPEDLDMSFFIATYMIIQYCSQNDMILIEDKTQL